MFGSTYHFHIGSGFVSDFPFLERVDRIPRKGYYTAQRALSNTQGFPSKQYRNRVSGFGCNARQISSPSEMGIKERVERVSKCGRVHRPLQVQSHVNDAPPTLSHASDAKVTRGKGVMCQVGGIVTVAP